MAGRSIASGGAGSDPAGLAAIGSYGWVPGREPNPGAYRPGWAWTRADGSRALTCQVWTSADPHGHGPHTISSWRVSGSTGGDRASGPRPAGVPRPPMPPGDSRG